MAVNIGPRIGIEGEDTYRKQIMQIIQETKTLKSEYEKVTSAFDKGKQSLSQNAEMHRVLQERIEAQKERVEQLNHMLGVACDQFGEASQKTLKWEQAVNEATAELNRMQRELDGLPSNIQLVGQKMEAVGNKMKEVGDKIHDGFNAIHEAVAPLSNLVVGTLSAVGGAVTAGIVGVTKQAVEGYAEAEQLVGGVDTLFKGASKKVQQYANEAYKTAGMGANEYMETVTNFSASLISSLGGDTQKAADLANQTIVDMSDNANKMGTDMTSIQNAYQGFAKQNYSMLDNLKLGFGGTQKEAYRLLQTAAELDEDFRKNAVFSMDSKGHLEAGFNDIVQAIHIVQNEMGITGTTAEEAEGTIEGSLKSVKSAWDNLINGLANDNLDQKKLQDNLVSTFETAFNNILPVAKRALEGVGQVITELAPIIKKKLPGIIEQLKPVLQTAFDTITAAIMQLIPPSFQEKLQNLVEIMSGVITSISEMWNSLSEEQKQGIFEAAANLALLAPIIDGIAKAGMIVGSIVSTIGSAVSAISAVLAGGVATVVAGVTGAVAAIVAFIDMLKNGWSAVATVVEAVGIAIAAVAAVVIGAPVAITAAIGAAVFGITQFIILLKDNWTQITEDIKKTWDNFVKGCKEAWDGLCKGLIDLWNYFSKGFNDGIKGIQAWWNGLMQNVANTWNSTVSTLRNAWQGVVNFFNTGINNIKNFFVGLWNNINSIAGNIRDRFDRVVDDLGNMFSNFVRSATNWGRDLIDNFIGGIYDMWDNARGVVEDFANMIADFLAFSEPEKGPLSNFHTYAPDMMKLFAKGIRDNANLVTNQIARSFDFQDLMTSDVALPVEMMPTAYAQSPSNTVTVGDTQIVINAVDGETAEELADKVSDIINMRYRKAEMAWA